MRTVSIAVIAIVIAMVGASFGAFLGNVTAAQSVKDSFGYAYTDSKGPAPSVSFQWIDISTTGTYTYASGDDDWAGPFPIGFDFAYYDQRFSAFNVTTNGYIMFGLGSSDYTYDPIPSTSNPDNIIAAYWDDLRADTYEIVYDTVGSFPNRQLVVEFMNVTTLGGSNLMTFEIVLNETGWDIWFNYLTMNGETGSGASIGIEDYDGSTGVRYGYNSAVVTDNLSVLFSLRDVVIGPSQQASGHTGDVISYPLIVMNRQSISDSIAITYGSVQGWTVGLYDALLNPLTDTDLDGLVDVGTLMPNETANITVTVSIPASPASAQEITSINASSHANPVIAFNCTLTTSVLAGWLEPPHSDYGLDSDSDTLYDYLVVDVNVGIFTSGWYTVEAYLHTSSEASIAYDYAQATLAAGSHTMSLQFYGWNINQAAEDGPYHVHLTLYNPSWVIIDRGIHTTASYTYDEFMLVPGEFTPPLSDSGVDTDSDAIYDYLQVDVPITVNHAGRFILNYNLYDPSWNIIASGSIDTTYSVGLNTPQLLFDAWDISRTGLDGTYHVSLYLYADVDGSTLSMGSYWYDTASYLFTDFERPSGLFIVGSYSDWVVDDDADFAYEFMVVEIGVNISVEGDYLVTATLLDWLNDPFLTASNLTHLTVGDHMVELWFPGWPIYYHSDSGSWDIDFDLLNGSLLLDELSDTTSGYSYTIFEQITGVFEAPHTDAGLDTDGDTLYDYLVVTVGVNVSDAGMYRIDAFLHDDWWSDVEDLSNTTYLDEGWNAVEFRFEGWIINSNANDGAYYADVMLYDDGARLLATDTIYTASYLYSSFEGIPAQFGSPHDWYVANDDGDAAYERLVVNVTVDVATQGRYLVEGDLEDSGWSMVATASVWADLAVGTQVVQLSFPGWLIYEFGTSGVFHIYLDLYDSRMYYLDWDSLQTTSLLPDDFDATVPRVNSAWASVAPSVDGIIVGNEWSGATVIDLMATDAMNGIDGQMRIMNDATTLYILIDAHNDMTEDEYDYATLGFDTGNDGVLTDGAEDQFLIRDTYPSNTIHYVYDIGWWSQHCYPFDHDGLAGQIGFGPSSTEAFNHRFYEFGIPLAVLGAAPGDILGFILRSASSYGVYDDTENVYSDWPIRFWAQPQLSQFADLVLADNAPEPPPVTTATVTGTAGSGGWHKSAVSVALSATGGDGGVAYTQYRLAGGSWQTYSAAIPISGEGTHTLEFRSVDNAAQTESTKTLTIKIDATGPTSVSAVSGASIWLNSTDATSGVGTTMYRIDAGAWTVYSGVLTMSEAGTYLIEFYAVDSAGNQEATKSVSVVVEKEDVLPDEPGTSSLIIWLGIGAAIAIAAVLIILFLLLKRKKGQQPADMMMQPMPIPGPPMMPPEPPPSM